jgi:hypothetical protein
MQYRGRFLAMALIPLLAVMSAHQALLAQTATHVVISEVQVAGTGGANDEFIEVYNPTSSAVDLSTWSIQYKSAIGAFSAVSKKNLTGTVPGFGFLLIANSSYTGTVAADVSHNSFQLASSGGNVFLVNDQTQVTDASDPNIVDRVAYGTGDSPEGTAVTPPSSGGSIERKAKGNATAVSLASGGSDIDFGNSFDTDDNSADFVLQTVSNPQNSSSAVEYPPVTISTSTSRFNSIQEGIDQVDAEGTVTVAPCTYAETLSFSKLLTITSGGVPSIVGDVTVSSSVTLNASFSIQGNIVIESEAVLADGGSGKVITTGSSSIDQGGTFAVPLEVSGGTTVVSGLNSFEGDISVGPTASAILQVHSETSLWAERNISVGTEGAISGPGTITFQGSNETFTNNGVVGASTTFHNSEGGLYYIAGDGTWGDVLIEDGVNMYASGNVTMENANITVDGGLNTLTHTLLLQGTSASALTVASSGSVIGTGMTVKTEGTVTIVQNGTFSESLEIVSGTTTAHGVFSGDIAIDEAGTLGIPSGDTLTADGNVTVEREYGEYKIAPTAPGGKRAQVPHIASSSAGAISGAGTLMFSGYGRTFTNDGAVDVATTFQNNDGDTKSISGSGGGSWKSLTIEGSASVSGGHTFTGSGTPFVVNGSVTLTTGSTIVYSGSAAQTVAALSYDNLEIANPSADVALGGATTVGGTLTISDHDLTTGAYTLTLGGSATIIETAPYAVLGNLTTARVCSTGVNQTFGGMGVEINASGTAPGATTVTRVTGTAPSFPPGIPVKRYFDITPSTNTGLNATFVYHYAANELNGNTESGLSLYRSTDGGTSWTQQGGTVSTGTHTVTLASVDEFSRWIAGGSTPENPAPAVTSVQPSTVALGTTTTLTLTGDDFIGGVSSPQFGSGILVNSFSVVSSGEISVNITVDPTAPVGVQNISVTNDAPGGGTATLTNGLNLVYPPPSLTSVMPSLIDRGQTLDVNLKGTGYYSGTTTVNFGADITVNSLAASGTTDLTANITVGTNATTGPRGVTVTNGGPGGGAATLANALTIANPAPTIVSITPAGGIRGETLDVTVTGTNFLVGVTTCSYGDGIVVNSVSSVTTTQVTANLTIDLGASPGSRDITVTNAAPGGGSATLAGAFSITNPVPTVSSVSPGQAGRGSKLTVAVTGTNFLEGVSSVSFGADISVNSMSITSSTQMTVDISIGASAATGSRSVMVTNAAPGGGSGSLPSGFTVDTSPATGVESMVGVIPDDYVLREAYPNPFNPSTTIGYGLPERSRVKLEVYNMLGNIVAVLVDGERSKGFYEVEWVAGNLPSGVYLIRLHSESLESSRRILASRKVVLVK